MEQILNELIKFYLGEKDHPIIDIPENYVNKREFLRGLLNVREPKPVTQEIIEKENELLKQELEEKKIIDINNFKDRFSLWQGDITTVKCDAIVDLTDSKLMGCMKPNHNCMSNKINTNAGVVLRLKCREITKGQPIETGKVILTDGFNLPCDKIIHAVKPELGDTLSEDEKNVISNLYINSLELAKKNDIKTLCIPNLQVNSSIKEEVSKIIIDTIKNWLKENDEVEKVLFDVYTLDDNTIYKRYFDEDNNESN